MKAALGQIPLSKIMANALRAEDALREERATESLSHQPDNLTYRVHPGAQGANRDPPLQRMVHPGGCASREDALREERAQHIHCGTSRIA